MPNTINRLADELPAIRPPLSSPNFRSAWPPAARRWPITSAVAAPDAVSPELLRLIEAHKAANEVYLHAHDRHAEAVAICDTAPTHLPFSWPYKGSEHLEMSKGLEASLNNVRFLIGWRAADELNVAHRGLPEKRQKQIAAAYKGQSRTPRRSSSRHSSAERASCSLRGSKPPSLTWLPRARKIRTQ